MDTKVTYRDVPGFPGYRVGNDGSVWSFASGEWREKKQLTLRHGYKRVTLSRDGVAHFWKVHRLVLTCFVGPCPEGMEGRHFPDRDPSNNRLENLQWGTRAANAADRTVHGTNPKCVKRSPDSLIAVKVQEIIAEYASGNATYVQIAKRHGISKTTVGEVVRGVRRFAPKNKPV